MSWRWVSLAALLAAVVIGYGAFIGPDSAPSTDEQEAPRPAYYLQDAVVLETNAAGAPHLQLSAARIEQRQGSDDFAAEDVDVRYFGVAEREWLLSAARASVPANMQLVEFSGDVELRPSDAAGESFLRTDALVVDMQRNVAYSTSSPVNIGFGRHTLQVRSFTADLTTEKVRLESVNGRFKPQ